MKMTMTFIYKNGTKDIRVIFPVATVSETIEICPNPPGRQPEEPEHVDINFPNKDLPPDFAGVGTKILIELES